MSASGARAVTVAATGPLALVQDPGRFGLAHLGVPRSGWLDDPAARLANRLVGNAEDAAVVECLLGGLVVVPHVAVTVGVTGARCPVRVGARPAAHGAAVSAPAGAPVEVGRPPVGARCYVALSGGIAVPSVLGSRATDTLSGTGPPPLRPGTVLPLGESRGVPAGVEAVSWPAPRPVVLAVHPGPRAGWFTGHSVQRLGAAAYTVQPDSDRVALRLDGPPLVRRQAGELPSEGLVLGAVQVPPDGRPLVFLHDHPTTGGYPVVGVVDRAALAACAQLLPGDGVRFRLRGW